MKTSKPTTTPRKTASGGATKGTRGPKSGGQPTIRDFAHAIGVSPTTVSRSIAGRGRISEETRQMVLKRMKELGFTPNLHAQRLGTGRAATVALCMKSTPQLFLNGLTHGLQQALQEYDYGLLIVGSGQLLKRWVDSRAVDGVVMVGGHVEGAMADLLNARTVERPGVPCIVIGTEPLQPTAELGSVYIDLTASVTKVAQELYSRGHRRIGYIGSSYSKGILPTFQAELARLGVPMQDEWAIIAGDNVDDGERAMSQLLQLETPPTAIFARTDELAVGGLRAARKLNVGVPEELSIVGHDDLPISEFADPPLATMRIDPDEIGKLVVELLFEMLDQPENEFTARSVNTELVPRGTLGPAPLDV